MGTPDKTCFAGRHGSRIDMLLANKLAAGLVTGFTLGPTLTERGHARLEWNLHLPVHALPALHRKEPDVDEAWRLWCLEAERAIAARTCA
eukprot:149951-Amphidinium_carterae.1